MNLSDYSHRPSLQQLFLAHFAESLEKVAPSPGAGEPDDRIDEEAIVGSTAAWVANFSRE
jgi:hypothetical protein